MKCPYCGSSFAGEPKYCPNCHQPLQKPKAEEPKQKQPLLSKVSLKTIGRRSLLVVIAIICLGAIGVGIYKLTYSISNYRLRRLYTRGAYTPTVRETTLDDGREGHTFIFYGNDGDQIFIPELDTSLAICGGTARTTIADSDWFDMDVSEVESADITLTPVLITETGKHTQLPSMTFSVEVPEAPLEVISPAESNLSIVTSKYLLELQVVAGSTVAINGEDVTSEVDRSGLLSKNVNVQPIGTNTYTVTVRTDKHRETRKEITIYRQSYDIDVELDSTVGNSSINETMAVSGHVEPGASITVETPYNETSLILDMTTGEFKFIAEFSDYGDNVVRFRATMDGRQDAIVNLTVNYTPNLAKYSAAAWKMDYTELKRLYATWVGRVFKCEGTIMDVFTENDVEYVVMDVSEDGTSQQYVVLENISSTKSPVKGKKYTAYADVKDRYMINAEYYPLLICRYMDVTA